MKFNNSYMCFMLATLLSSLVHGGEIEINGSSIYLELNADSIVSRNTEEVQLNVNAGNIVSLNIDEGVVIRSNTEKLSFSPLDEGMFKDKRQVVGFDIPASFTSVMTLFQSFYTESGQAKNECEILVLEALLGASNRARLRKFFVSSAVVIKEQDGFYSFACGQSKES